MKLYVAAILAIVFFENLSMHIVRGAFGSQTMAQSFCQDLRKKPIKLENIDRYEKLTNRPVEAVIITTKKGDKVCVSPEERWVKKAIHQLEQKAALAQLKSSSSPKAVINQASICQIIRS
ncbi:hypothetical protein JD844_033012 [Phrynosoma platyrhinos]|uniref:Chemokine interleukin-8-like domain-containing protein n=1 Tax=Phrynosoma platyrhinos TaxID=52577 RepID=A0ABQ7T660_PHRPL|nr:hypothetical protein JD844_033012 [Phrynosoma platyrhinos]